MPFLPEMQEVQGIKPFLAPQGLDKETLTIWAILAVFKDSKDTTVVTTHTSQSGHQQQVLLMICEVIVVRPDSTSYKARALLDPGSSA